MAETETNKKLGVLDAIINHTQVGGVRPYPLANLTIQGTDKAPHPPHYLDVQLDSDMIMKRCRIAAARVGGWAWAAGKVKPSGICVEIGVDWGDGIDRWLTGNPAIVIGVDPWLSMEWDNWFDQPQKEMDERHRFVVNRYVGRPVSIVRKTSDDFFGGLTSDFKADWWFIDGDHREEPCYKDVCNALKFSNKGAWIFLDDIDCGKWAEPIGKALDRFLAEHGDEVECVWLKSSPVAIRVK